MKQLLIIIACYYCVAPSLFPQNYVAEYQSSVNAKNHLLFNATAWRYNVTALDKIEITIESNYYDASEFDEDSSLSSTSKSISTFYFRSLDKNEYLDEELLYEFDGPPKSCVIRGRLEKPEWNILSDSVKTIEKYTCLMAKGFVRGRNYTVWFTPDIPVSAGPWKLWGLPGLIVSAQSDDGKVRITMISLKQTEAPPEEPEVIRSVTHEEFKALYRDSQKKSLRNLRAFISSEDAVIDITTSAIDHPDKSLLE